MLERLGKIKSFLLFDRIPTYRGMAEFYKRRAFIDSFHAGYHIDPQEGVDLIDATDSIALTLPDNRSVEFALNSDGVFFARIEGSKFYPINSKLAQGDLELSHMNEQLAKRSWRRILDATYFGERLEWYNLSQSQAQNLDSIFLLNRSLEGLLTTLEGINTDLRKVADKLAEKAEALRSLPQNVYELDEVVNKLKEATDEFIIKSESNNDPDTSRE